MKINFNKKTYNIEVINFRKATINFLTTLKKPFVFIYEATIKKPCRAFYELWHFKLKVNEIAKPISDNRLAVDLEAARNQAELKLQQKYSQGYFYGLLVEKTSLNFMENGNSNYIEALCNILAASIQMLKNTVKEIEQHDLLKDDTWLKENYNTSIEAKTKTLEEFKKLASAAKSYETTIWEEAEKLKQTSESFYKSVLNEKQKKIRDLEELLADKERSLYNQNTAHDVMTNLHEHDLAAEKRKTTSLEESLVTLRKECDDLKISEADARSLAHEKAEAYDKIQTQITKKDNIITQTKGALEATETKLLRMTTAFEKANEDYLRIKESYDKMNLSFQKDLKTLESHKVVSLLAAKVKESTELYGKLNAALQGQAYIFEELNKAIVEQQQLFRTLQTISTNPFVDFKHTSILQGKNSTRFSPEQQVEVENHKEYYHVLNKLKAIDPRINSLSDDFRKADTVTQELCGLLREHCQQVDAVYDALPEKMAESHNEFSVNTLKARLEKLQQPLNLENDRTVPFLEKLSKSYIKEYAGTRTNMTLSKPAAKTQTSSNVNLNDSDLDTVD